VEALVWALAGLIFGSFANVCIYRIPKGISIVKPPSHCTACGNRLTPVELIPVLSWLLQKGCCKNCGKRISVQYPVVELVSATLFLLALGHWGITLTMPCWVAFFWILLVIAWIDGQNKIIPDSLLLAALVCWVPLAIQHVLAGYEVKALLPSLYGALAGGGSLMVVLLACLVILKREGLGWGDVKLMAVAGLYLGLTQTVVALLVGVYIGAIVVLIMLALKRWKRGTAVPFAPFLTIGIVTAALWGQTIANWYFQLIGM